MPMKFYFQTKGQVFLTNYEQFRRDLHGGSCEAGTLTGLKLSETGPNTLAIGPGRVSRSGEGLDPRESSMRAKGLN